MLRGLQHARRALVGIAVALSTSLTCAGSALVSIGSSSGPIQVTVTASATGTISTLTVYTGGVPNLEYTLADQGTCTSSLPVISGQTCTANVIFTPRYPGQRFGAVVLRDANNAVIGSGAISQVASGPLGVFVPGLMSTVAGDENWLYRGDGGPATSSAIFLPFGVAVDAAGNLFIADSSNNRIRRVDASTGFISTYAGNGNSGPFGDGGPATSASLSTPTSIALDGAGNVYFADSGNNAIRRIDSSTGTITTIAGSLGTSGASGDGASATHAKLNSPNGIALDGSGKLYIADTGNNVIRVVDLAAGTINRFAGTYGIESYTGDGAAALLATLNSPWGVTVAPTGEIYIADQYNHCIRKVTLDLAISTVVGNGNQGYTGDGGLAPDATLNEPASIAIDAAGNLYIADSGNNAVRKVSSTTGLISTVVGNGNESFAGDGGPSNQASLYGPYTLALDGPGNLYIADLFHNRIRMVASNTSILGYPDMRVLRTSATETQALENDGNSPLTIASLVAGTNAVIDNTTTTCSSTPLAMNSSCVLGAKFAPTTTGSNVQGTIAINSDSANTPNNLILQGNVLSLDPPTVTISSSGSPAATGSTVVFTISVTSAGITPTGTVTVLDGATPLGTATLSSGATSFSTNTLAVGSHSITASYAGDTNNAPRVSAAITQVILDGTNLALSASPGTAGVLTPVTFTVTISGDTASPTGVVKLLDGGNVLSSTSPTGNVATFTTSTLAVGTHHMSASYAGDTHSLPSVSAFSDEIITQSSTSTALTSSNPDVTFSTSINLTATVTSVSAGPPTGTVNFLEGTTIIGSATLDTHGVGTLPIATLAVGQHSLTAAYSGDTNNAVNTSPSLQQTIEQIATSTTLASSANPANSGTSLHLAATVAPALTVSSAPITGTVTFFDAGTALGTVTTSSGAAALDVNSLSVGGHSITAKFNGATDYTSSTSVAMPQAVQKATTAGTLTASANPNISGKPVVLTAEITSPGVVPTGNVTFQDGATILGQATLNSSGIATFPITSLAPSTHSLVASYPGDSNSLPTSLTLSLVVQRATTSTVVSATPSPAVVGTTVVLSATVAGNGGTPGGVVTFRDGAATLGTGQLNGAGVATLSVNTFTVGTHTLSAVYAGDTDDLPSTSPNTSEVAQQTTTTTALTPTPNPAAQGTAIQIAVHVTSNAGIPGGTVQIMDGSVTLGSATLNASGVGILTVTSFAAGPHNLSATYPGDTNDGGSTSAVVTEVIQPTTTITLSSDHNPVAAGAVLTLSASVSGSSVLPTGTVTFHDGSAILGTAALSPAGIATLHTTALAPTTHLLTATYSGDNANASSVSAPYSQGVVRAISQTQLALGSSAIPVTTSTTLTATITGNGGIPGGGVTFLDGSTSLGSAIVGSSGTASITVSTLALGLHSLTAIYAGDTNDTGSTSPAQQLTVTKAVPTLAVASSINPSLGGTLIVLTASLHSAGSTPTGLITWSDSGTVLGFASLSANGVATLSIATLSVGQHLIVASFPGDANNGAATSGTLTEVVQLAPSSVALTSSKNPALVGDSVSYVVVLSGPGGHPTGAITLKDGSASLGSVTVDASGRASLPVTVSTPGTHTITAIYAGDAFHSGSQSSALAQAVLQPTSTTIATSGNPSIAGRSLTLTAKIAPADGVAPTGTVTFLDGTATLSTVPLSTAGIATWSTTNLTVGQHSVTAIYNGDVASQTSTSTVLIETIIDASTTTTLVSSNNPATSGSPVTLTAQVTGQGKTPTGTVTFQDGAVVLGQATLSAAGVGALTTSSLFPGQHTLAVLYTGDANNLTSTSAPLTQLVQQRTAISISSSSSPSLTASPVTFTVDVTNSGVGIPTGSVTLTDGGTTIGTALLAANGAATFTTAALSAGTHSLIASYSGDTQNFSSGSSAFSQIIQLRSSTTSLTSSLSTATTGEIVTLIAVVQGVGPATPTGPVIFTSGGTTLGTATLNASGVATLNLTPATGNYNAVAIYGGDALYGSSTSPVSSVTVNAPAHFTLTMNPSSISLQTRQHQTVQLTVASLKGFADTLSLGCAGLPYAATCTFSNDQVTLQSDGSATVSIVVDTGSPLTAGGETQASVASGPTPGIALCFLPIGALASLLLLRARCRNSLGSLVAILLLAVAAAGAIGCGSINVNGTPAGKYNVTLTATGAATGVTVSQTFPLTVSK